MKSPFLLLLVATSAGALGAQVTAPEQSAAPAQGAVTLQGEVVAEGSGTPIPYTTVKLQPLGRERFADRAGAFVYYSINPGEYKLQLRMVGYIPVDTTIVVKANIPVVVTMTMKRIATALDAVEVKAPPRLCLFPDEMGYVADPELATILDEARKNAQREQLLRRTYPFEYKLAQSHDTYDIPSRTSALMYDTVLYRSDDSWRYRKGRVVSDDRNRIFGDVRLMRLPTVADLADRNFLSAHCFKYAGIVDEGGKPAHRIDFAPDSNLVAPDVEGSIFLDSATYLIKRAQFKLTRGGSVKPAILGMEVTTTYKEILPNVLLFDEIRSVQPLAGGAGILPVKEFRETQKLLTYRFLYSGPPGTTVLKWIPAAGDSTALAGKDSVAAKSATPTGASGPPPEGPPPNK
ncbi:MAG TPA: carboxypeptidase-like regulatory domain-containing protein [Gemmatimonadaceae bacterium]